MANVNTGAMSVLSELVFPPFGFVMCFESPPPDERLTEITWFSQFGYGQWKEISRRLPVLPIYTAYPGDYRDRGTVLREIGEGGAYQTNLCATAERASG